MSKNHPSTIWGGSNLSRRGRKESRRGCLPVQVWPLPLITRNTRRSLTLSWKIRSQKWWNIRKAGFSHPSSLPSTLSSCFYFQLHSYLCWCSTSGTSPSQEPSSGTRKNMEFHWRNGRKEGGWITGWISTTKPTRLLLLKPTMSMIWNFCIKKGCWEEVLMSKSRCRRIGPKRGKINLCQVRRNL